MVERPFCTFFALYSHFIRTLFALLCPLQPLPLTLYSHFICTFLHFIYIFITLSTRGAPQAYTLFGLYLHFICISFANK